MKSMNLSNETQFVKKTYSRLPKTALIAQPLSEETIIDIQNIFMARGIHHLRVKNVFVGREIIANFLNALNCYIEIGCLSIYGHILPENIWDMYYQLVLGGYIQNNYMSKREEFFVQEFYAQFIWVEITDTLLEQPWFYDVQQAFVDLYIDQHIPLVFVSYDDE